MSTVVISIEGTDITDDIIFKDAEFITSAKGAAGQARFRIKDLRHEKSFVVGNSLTLDIDGIRKWSGFVMAIHRGYFWDGSPHKCDTNLVPRYLLIEGADANILLNKRVLYDKSAGETVKLTPFPAGTDGKTIIDYYVANHTDLVADGVTTTLVENLGTPSVDSEISGSASWRVNDFLHYVNYNLGGIWYLNPTFDLVFTDVDTPSAAYGISDQPGAGEVGCRDLKILSSGSDMRNDALVWGVGQGPAGVPVFSREQDQTSLTLHGRWQKGDFNQSVYKQATVDHIAHSYVYGSPVSKRGGKDDQVTIKCTVFTPSFTVAEKVPLRSAVFGYSDVVPIRSQRISFPTKEQPEYELTLSFDVDDPWSTAEFWWPNWITNVIPIPTVPVPVWPLPVSNPCGPATYCCDTFTRTGNGLGTSEFGGYVYQGGTTVFRTDGSRLEVLAFTGAPSIRSQLTSLTLGYPLRLQYEFTPVVSGTLRFETYINDSYIGGTHGFYRVDVTSPVTSGGLATVSISAVDSLSNGRQFASSPQWALGLSYTIQLYVTPTLIAAKFWPTGSAEPPDILTDRYADQTHVAMDGTVATTWTMAPQTVWAWTDGNSGHVALGDPWAYVDNFCVLEGLNCNGNGEVTAGGCTDTTVPDNSCLPTYRCETLTQITTPPNQPDTYTYWATANNQQFQLSTTEVWVNGLRIRLGYDYDEHYTEGYIGVHAGIANDRSMIGGVLEGDGSGDIVRMCYWTACYLITVA